MHPQDLANHGHGDQSSYPHRLKKQQGRLVDLGVTPGSIVGIALEDSIEHVLLLYAAARAGAVILPMDCRWRDNEKQRLAAHFEPAAVMVEPGAAFDGAPCIAVDEAWRDAVVATDPERDFPDGARGIAMSLSSGTTGRPKSPMVSHQKFLNRFWTHWVDLGFGSRETYINATPLYFGGGRAFSMSTLYAGGTVVLCPPPYKPEALAAEVATCALQGAAPGVCRRGIAAQLVGQGGQGHLGSRAGAVVEAARNAPTLTPAR
ncbi:AMP-binding protein [Variovorax sp. J31P207]|nr:AMP-binding protein [Variovorax sp. J31P207]MDM0070640.1 AMP-binding protein [Variovorax sp. J31P207]